MNTFKNWLLENLKEELTDIATHGCEGGFTGLIYYHETSLLYDTYQNEIWEMLCEDAESFCDGNVPSFISSLNGSKNVSDEITFKNLLVWYAAERLADQIINSDENEE
jgi:hypothetical protein